VIGASNCRCWGFGYESCNVYIERNYSCGWISINIREVTWSNKKFSAHHSVVHIRVSKSFAVQTVHSHVAITQGWGTYFLSRVAWIVHYPWSAAKWINFILLKFYLHLTMRKRLLLTYCLHYSSGSQPLFWEPHVVPQAPFVRLSADFQPNL